MASPLLPTSGKSKALSVLNMAFFMLETRERMSNIGPLAILRPLVRSRSVKAFADRLTLPAPGTDAPLFDAG